MHFDSICQKKLTSLKQLFISANSGFEILCIAKIKVLALIIANKGEENLTKCILTVGRETEHFCAQLYFQRVSSNPRCQKEWINLLSVGTRLESIAECSCQNHLHIFGSSQVSEVSQRVISGCCSAYFNLFVKTK